jgi:hypothetical protein
MVTSQGRETLQSSVELTTSLGANVIYGDTGQQRRPQTDGQTGSGSAHGHMLGLAPL